MQNLVGAAQLFHELVLLADLIWILCIYLLAKRGIKRLLIPLFLLAVLHLTCSLIAAFWVAKYYGLRDYAVEDFFVEAVFYHFPASLLICSFFLPRGKWGVRALVFLQVICFVYVYFIESNWIEVTRYSYSHPLLAGLKRPIRIVQVAEIQSHHIGSLERKMLLQIQSLHPDLVVFTGDYFHIATGEEEQIEARRLQELMKKIRVNAPLGAYAIKGDSDTFEVLNTICSGTGVQFLDNYVMVLKLPGVDVNLIGLSAWFSRAGTARKLWRIREAQKPGLFNLYITHTADFVDTMSDSKESFLILSGHAHQGQLEVPFVGPLATPSRLPREYADGFHQYGSGAISISRGLGMGRRDWPSLQLICRPEIRVIELQPYVPTGTANQQQR